MTPRIIMGLGIVLALTVPVSAAELSIVGNGPNFQWSAPLAAGSLVWFDVILSDPMGESAEGSQITVDLAPVGHDGSLTFLPSSSAAVEDDPAYWVFGNSAGINALDLGASRFQFGDSPDNPSSAVLEQGDILARFAFTWDGTVGQYTISPDSSTQYTLLLQGYTPVAPIWDSGSVTLWVPEPASAALVAVAALLGMRRR